MKVVIIILLILLVSLQYKLWISGGGIPESVKLKKAVLAQEEVNESLRARNAVLEAEVRDLKQGNDAIVERARSDLGMIKQDETFYLVIPDAKESK